MSHSRLRTSFWLTALAAALLTATSAQAWTVTNTSANAFYVGKQDFSTVNCMYVAYRVNNDGATDYSDVWVRIDPTSFSGGVVGFAPQEDGVYHVGPMLHGTTKMVYFYLQASGLTGSAQSHAVQVYSGKPGTTGATQLNSRTFTLNGVLESIRANANKVDVVFNNPNPATIGGIVTITVNGHTGTFGDGEEFIFTPAADPAWPAKVLRLFSTVITLDSPNAGNFTDVLSIPAVAIGADTPYTVVYQCRISGVKATSTAVAPVQHIASGTQIKHTGTYPAGGVDPILPTFNSVVLSKLASASSVPGSSNITFTLRLTNTNLTQDAVIEDFVDTLPTAPATVTYLGPSLFNGATITPQVSGNVLTWSGSFSVPANSSRDLTFRATIPGTFGVYTNSAVAHVGTAQIDSTIDTANNTPALATVTVAPLADISVTKSGPSGSVAVGSNITYTVTVNNLGPATATNVVVSDVLPTGVTFVSATGGVTPSGGVVTWSGFSLANGVSSNLFVVVSATGSGTLTNTAQATTTVSVDQSLANNTSTVFTAVSSSGVVISGLLFNDLQPNGMADAGEDWIAGTNVFVNLVSGGTVIASVGIAPGTGAFTFSNVTAGAYSMVVATTSNSATAVVPSGWLFTAPTDGTRGVTVGSNPVTAQDFGLFHGGRLTGRVFNDNGAGGGVANNGTNEVGEAGIPGVTVRLTDSGGGTTYGTTTTDGAGNYTLYAPFTLGAVPLKVVETNLSPYLSISGSAGTTGGSYVRATDTVSFNNTPGTSYSGVNFGDVPANTFAPDNNLAALPGTVVFFPHLFTAGSAGTVTFSTTSTVTTNLPGWSQQVLLDANCNGSLDAGDTAVTGPISVTAGQALCILVKEYVPAGAPLNAVDVVNVQANFGYTGATPVLNSTYVRTDTLTVGNTTTAGLVLTKAVDKATALPGETITYTVTYRNNSDGPLSNVVVFDQTPAYTTFVSAGNGVLPSNLTGVTITKPAVGATGAIRWEFTGTLASSATGTVTFAVQVVP